MACVPLFLQSAVDAKTRNTIFSAYTSEAEEINRKEDRDLAVVPPFVELQIFGFVLIRDRGQSSQSQRQQSPRMSTFGGDSWGREAHHRKRRVDDLMLSSSSGDAASSPSFKKLSSGKFVCLVCPHNPILDNPLMLSMHNKGSRHIAAESKARESELSKRDESKKRLALSADSTGLSNSGNSRQQIKNVMFPNKPLIQKTMKAISESQCKNVDNPNAANAGHCSNITTSSSIGDSNYTCTTDGISVPPRNITGTANKILADWNSELLERREKELKFTAAGWKRDCHGKWYRDENVEFDSDEEDPNMVLE
ncbi:hypothetical protein ZIOFF_063730 [Zingiber officinale]|uniref:Sodium channel modifier 1 n=2 Tax=Zingiber officinale TaxID=94328 RepID=A0A8J5K9W6_ZINOF|nr:hypothetical protein ZIOFF_063730 [Zingiber officinale]